jgi:hypothetical protein
VTDADRAGISATTFLLLCVAWGPDRAVFVLMLVAIAAGWFWLTRSFPRTAWILSGFIRGLFGR